MNVKPNPFLSETKQPHPQDACPNEIAGTFGYSRSVVSYRFGDPRNPICCFTGCGSDIQHFIQGLPTRPKTRGVLLVSRLVVAMSYTSLFFRTTSNLEIRQSLERVELAVSFGHSRLSFSKAFALFLNFLPQLFAIWTGLDKTWKARCGKRGIRKIIVLLPVFIALSMKKANDTLMSLRNRR